MQTRARLTRSRTAGPRACPAGMRAKIRIMENRGGPAPHSLSRPSALALLICARRRSESGSGATAKAGGHHEGAARRARAARTALKSVDDASGEKMRGGARRLDGARLAAREAGDDARATSVATEVWATPRRSERRAPSAAARGTPPSTPSPPHRAARRRRGARRSGTPGAGRARAARRASPPRPPSTMRTAAAAQIEEARRNGLHVDTDSVSDQPISTATTANRLRQARGGASAVGRARRRLRCRARLAHPSQQLWAARAPRPSDLDVAAQAGTPRAGNSTAQRRIASGRRRARRGRSRGAGRPPPPGRRRRRLRAALTRASAAAVALPVTTSVTAACATGTGRQRRRRGGARTAIW